MAKSKLIHRLSAEDNMDFNEVVSFETDSYIGIWDVYHQEFVIIKNRDTYFEMIPLKCCDNFEELDGAVYEECDEHINFVSNKSSYWITLENLD